MTANTMRKLYTGTLAAALIMAFAAPADAGGFYSVAPRNDINMCVAEVSERANYDEASRVRHEVISTKRRTVGYRLDIETTVFEAGSGDVIREYKSTCLATGGKRPSRFEIREQAD